MRQAALDWPGYTGTLLRVDLTVRRVEKSGSHMAAVREFIGGSALAGYLLARESDPTLDPYAPDSMLIFMTGPFTGTPVPTSGRHAVVAKSPLTGIWGESDAGGRWGGMLKRAGYDGLVVVGRSDVPVYLLVEEKGIEIRDASGIWGQDTFTTAESIQAETRPEAVIACIGPAGENRVRFAGVVGDGRNARVAARCGLGAVMGSKNLKAIAVYGEGEVVVADPGGLKERSQTISRQLVKLMKSMSLFGTAGSIVPIEIVGDLPIQNWTQGQWAERAGKISGMEMAKTILTGRTFCESCSVGCGRRVSIPADDPYGPVEGAGPEYETLAMLGSMVQVDNLKAIAKANDLCNRYGLDTISTGAAIAFAFEAREHGLLQEGDGRIPLEWGNPEAVLALIEEIAGRRGKLGNLLADGVRRAAEQMGGLALEMAVHTKGLELPAHDPRAYNSVGLSYATSNRGACHLAGLTHPFERSLSCPDLGYGEVQDRFGVKGKGKFTADLQNLMGLLDALKICKFSLFGGLRVNDLLDFMHDVTGWTMDLQQFMETGERIFNLKRLYNLACGISRKDDTLPPRILTWKRKTGGAAENLPPLHQMLSQYYEARGWDEFGALRPDTIQRLGLEAIARRLKEKSKGRSGQNQESEIR